MEYTFHPYRGRRFYSKKPDESCIVVVTNTNKMIILLFKYGTSNATIVLCVCVCVYTKNSAINLKYLIEFVNI